MTCEDCWQKPVVTKSKKSIAGFKIREDYPVGCKVTLRRERMYEFLDRLITVAIPRIRDFRGIPAKSFDGRGNYNMGVREQIIFPEIEYDKIDALAGGMNITITTTAKTDEEARALLAAFKFLSRIEVVWLLCMINREEKRRSTAAKYAEKRAKLIAIVNDSKLTDEERLLPVCNFNVCRVMRARFASVIAVH